MITSHSKVWKIQKEDCKFAITISTKVEFRYRKVLASGWGQGCYKVSFTWGVVFYFIFFSQEI